jgi:hypothetical protein
MLKGEGSVIDGRREGRLLPLAYKAPLFDQPWINSPKSSINGNAYKIDVALNSLVRACP